MPALRSDLWQVAKSTGCWLSATKIADVHMLSVHSNPNFQGGEEQAGSCCQSKDQLLHLSGSSPFSNSSIHYVFPYTASISVGMQSWEPDGLLALKVGLEIAPQHKEEDFFVSRALETPSPLLSCRSE